MLHTVEFYRRQAQTALWSHCACDFQDNRATALNMLSGSPSLTEASTNESQASQPLEQLSKCILNEKNKNFFLHKMFCTFEEIEVCFLRATTMVHCLKKD